MLLARRAQQWSHSCTAAAVMGRLHRPALLLRISTQRHHASSLVAAADRASSLVAAVDRARDAARLRPPPPVVARYLATRAPDAYAAAHESNFRDASPPLLNHDLHAIDADTRSSASRAA